LVAVATRTAEAGAFTTAGAHSENRTRSAPIPTACTAFVLNGQFVEMLGNAPSRSACKANQQPSASIPNGLTRGSLLASLPEHGASESNAVLRI